MIYIERDDFLEEPPKKFYRLAGRRSAPALLLPHQCEEVVKDAEGNITELRCTYDPMSGGGSSSDGRQVKGVIHAGRRRRRGRPKSGCTNPLFTKEEDPDDVEERDRRGRTTSTPSRWSAVCGIWNPRCAMFRRSGRAVRTCGLLLPDTDSTPKAGVQPHDTQDS